MMRDQMAKIPRPLLTLLLAVLQRIIGYNFSEFAPRNRIALVGAAVMLVHGDADPVVPIDSLHELAEAHPGAEVLVVAGGGHSDLTPCEPHVGDITGFLNRHLR
jgi:pimeloyl-ACP methyl ester carboxylesterase